MNAGDVVNWVARRPGGIEPGDKLTEVDGHAVTGWTISEVIAKLRGEPRSAVQLTLQRAVEPPVKVLLQRARISLSALYDAPLKRRDAHELELLRLLEGRG